jgi:flagellar basal body-associated protein FliL
MPLRELIVSGPRSLGTSRFLIWVYRVLLIIILLILTILLGGTLYALIVRDEPDAPPPPVSAPAGAETAVFTGLGRLRVPTAGPEGGTVVLSVAFPYYPGDRPFSEELASRIRDLREITTTYLGSLSAAELGGTDEALLKRELLSRYNAALRLGSVETLYFDDFMIIE